MDVSGNIEVKLAYNTFGEVGEQYTSVVWINSSRLVAEINCCIRCGWPYEIQGVRSVSDRFENLDGF